METLLAESLALLEEMFYSYDVAGDSPETLRRYREHIADLKLRISSHKESNA